jgi:acetyltransferase-like isoleucine patch superfamily enzyme
MFEYRNERKVSSVSIEDDVWIGANVIILPGVTIAEGSIVGAGSVVTKSTEPYSINVGNPSKLIKYRFSKENINLHLMKINKIKCNNSHKN